MKCTGCRIQLLTAFTLTLAGSGLAQQADMAPQMIDAKAARIVDGGNLEFEQAGKMRQVKLYGVAAPTAGAPMAAESTQMLAKLTGGKQLLIGVIANGANDSVMGEVLDDQGISVNRLMVRYGMARWDSERAPGDLVLKLFESVARQEQTGVWAPAAMAAAAKFAAQQAAAQAASEAKPPAPALTDGLARPKEENAPFYFYHFHNERVYHKQGCRELNRSKEIESITPDEVKLEKYKACRVCRPDAGVWPGSF